MRDIQELAKALRAVQNLKSPEVRTLLREIASLPEEAENGDLGLLTLLRRLAFSYAKDGVPVLSMRVPEVVTRMSHHGTGFMEAILALGTDGSGIELHSLSGWEAMETVILCDGLDECGPQHERMAEAIAQFAAAHPRTVLAPPVINASGEA